MLFVDADYVVTSSCSSPPRYESYLQGGVPGRIYRLSSALDTGKLVEELLARSVLSLLIYLNGLKNF